MKVELKEETIKEIEKETKAITEDIKKVNDTQEIIKKTILEQQRLSEKCHYHGYPRSVAYQ